MNAPLDREGFDAVPLDLTDRDALHQWCLRLEVNETWLREAVAKVGAMPAAVFAYSRTRSKLMSGMSPEMEQHQRRLDAEACKARVEKRKIAAAKVAERRVLL